MAIFVLVLSAGLSGAVGPGDHVHCCGHLHQQRGARPGDRGPHGQLLQLLSLGPSCCCPLTCWWDGWRSSPCCCCSPLPSGNGGCRPAGWWTDLPENQIQRNRTAAEICGSPAVLSSALRRRGGRFFSAVGGDCRAARDNGHRQPRLQSCPPQTEEYVSPERRPTGKRTGGPAGRCERRPAGWASGITAAKGSADGYAEEASRRRHPDRGGLWRDARPGP